MKKVDKKDFVSCPECEVRLKKENLYSHLIENHPEVEKTREMEEERKEEINELREYIKYLKIISDENKCADYLLENIEDISPEEKQSHEYWVGLGSSHLLKEDYEEAKRCYEKALDIKPGFEDAEDLLEQVELILYLMEKDDWDEDDIPEMDEMIDETINEGFIELASHLCKKILEMDLDNFSAKYQIAYIHMKKGDLEKSKKGLEEILGEDPSFTSALGNLALVYMSLEEFDNAKETYERFLKVSPEFAPGWNNLALIYMRDEKYEKALENVNKSIEIDKNYGMGWFSKYQILTLMGREREAKRCLDKAMDLDPRIVSQIMVDHLDSNRGEGVKRYETNWGKY